ncbi:MAG TPA: DUF3667 domain-containing protein [Caulobacteraceae bacterium]|nr:DUF3667 domain-containing protein [Caulobacteraceae bacterium]
MSREIEAAALDSVKAVLGSDAPRHALPLGAPCPNCATPLAGPWCHACGQSSDDHHRSLARLTAEAIGGLIDVDSRLWRTLPDLCLRPARLTRAYLDGHRVSQIPPFRLFLVVIVLLFLAVSLEPNGSGPAPLGNGKAIAAEPQVKLDLNVNGQQFADAWVTARLKTIAKNPQRFETALFDWAQRLAVLALPTSAGLLGLMFFWRRGIYLFDHLIFSMHSLSFQGLLLSITMLAGRLNGAFELLLLIAPVHLFAHLKGVYRLGMFGTLSRMLVLFIGSAFGFMVALAGLVVIGLYEVGA